MLVKLFGVDSDRLLAKKSHTAQQADLEKTQVTINLFVLQI